MGRGARSFDQSTKATILVKGDDDTEVIPKDFMDGLEDLENLRMMNGQLQIQLSTQLHDVQKPADKVAKVHEVLKIINDQEPIEFPEDKQEGEAYENW